MKKMVLNTALLLPLALIFFACSSGPLQTVPATLTILHTKTATATPRPVTVTPRPPTATWYLKTATLILPPPPPMISVILRE